MQSRKAVFGVLLSVAAFAEAGRAQSTPTFHKDVAPILQKNCQTCHRPGQIAPMSFLTYKDARPWAKAMKAAVLTKKMPPWFADPKVGHFSNERRLSEAEIETLVKWADNGAPEGDAKDRPAPVVFADGWEIGKPDIVVEMEKDVQIPATGIVDTRSVYVKVNFPEDIWVQAAEIRPGNREMVHHMKAWVVYPSNGPRTRASMGDGVGREILAKYNPG